MQPANHIGLEQARSEFPRLVSQAQTGTPSVITRHGKPCAALVPLSDLAKAQPRGGLLVLQGSGAGLWGARVTQTVAALGNEWA